MSVHNIPYFILDDMRPVEATFDEWYNWLQLQDEQDGYVAFRDELIHGDEAHVIVTSFRGVGNNKWMTQWWPKQREWRDIKAHSCLAEARNFHVDFVKNLVDSGKYRLVQLSEDLS